MIPRISILLLLMHVVNIISHKNVSLHSVVPVCDGSIIVDLQYQTKHVSTISLPIKWYFITFISLLLIPARR